MTDPRHAELDRLFRKADAIFNSDNPQAENCRSLYMRAFNLREQMRADGLTIAPEYDDQRGAA